MTPDQEFSLAEWGPDTLFDISLKYLINNINVITQSDLPSPVVHSDSSNKWYKLREDVILPAEICERFLEVYQKNRRVTDDIAYLFSNCAQTRLTSIKLRNSPITDKGFRVLMQHKPYELDLVECEHLTQASLDIINRNSENLVSVRIGPQTYVLSSEEAHFLQRGFILNAPQLKRLALQQRGIQIVLFTPLFFVKPLTQLTHLDISDCTLYGSIWTLSELKLLRCVIMHNFACTQGIIDWLSTLTTLRHLDLSQSNERQGKFKTPNEVLSQIVTNLPNLEHLDISGTNLAGTGAAVMTTSVVAHGNQRTPASVRCDIPGLATRVDNPLEFLGLYGTHHSACKRHDIPAKIIAGDANEEQILAAAVAYMERPTVLSRVLNDLYYLFRYENNTQVPRALLIVLTAMERHLFEKHIQISGSAILFYIAKGKEKNNLGTVVKRRIIAALLAGMEAHLDDETMMRNGCLTLCQFKIPTDVVFVYERVVLILLNSVGDIYQESFVLRIAIYLLNSLACQVDGSQKRFLGDNGAITKMLSLISERVERHVCDDVLEVAWSTMWNVTDETPQNCRRFLDNEGMEHFLNCLQSFPDKDELLRNMMGLLGNVAEVEELRPRLMNTLFLSVFYDLLECYNDGIEVSYNAAGVLAHMASDGEEAWSVETPRREDVLARVATSVSRWSLRSERNINYRSFEPILGLLHAYHTPQCQHWAVWALANLTTVYPAKYCKLVVAEGGTMMLANLLHHPEPYESIKELARVVIENCENFAMAELAAAEIAAAELAMAELVAAAAPGPFRAATPDN